MITLRQWPEDAEEALRGLYRDVDQSRCLVAVNTDSPEQTKKYIHIIRSGDNEGRPFICRAVYLDDLLIGKAELTAYSDGSAELDIVIRREYTGKGIGARAVTELAEEAAGTKFCGKIRAYVSSDNIPAGRMLMKTGFKPVRKFRADIMTPGGNDYKLQEKTGYEFILDIPEPTLS